MRRLGALLAWTTVAACAAACGGGGAEEPERAPLEPRPEPVQIELAWVVSAAPTEVKEVECRLVLRVVRPKGDPKGELHELGRWWRAQTAAIELVEPTSAAAATVFFRTEAAFGSDGDLTKAPQFEVVREAGAVIVRGRDEDTPWRQLERIEVPPRTPVDARRMQTQ